MTRLALRVLPLLLLAACGEQDPVEPPSRPYRDVVVGSLGTDSTYFGLARPCPHECGG